MRDSGGGGRFGGDAPFGVIAAGLFGQTAGNVDNLSMVARGTILVPETSPYTFVVNSDDGFELSIDGAVINKADYGKGTGDVLGSTLLSAGEHTIQLVYWDGLFDGSVELFAAPGEWTWFDREVSPGVWVPNAEWRLVGDSANGGLALVPEPAALGALAVAGITLLARRRRKA